MKKKLVLAMVLFLMGYGGLQACAICGCGAGNYYFGIMPQYQKNFVGVRYYQYSFTSHIGQGYSPYEATHETFHTTELWMRFYPTPRIQIFSLLDYNFNTQIDQGVTKKLQGIGDIPVFVNYNLVNTTLDPSANTRIVNHNLFVGGGIKLPTGKYKFDEDPAHVANANFQLGTGSVDFFLNTQYTLRYKRMGLSANATYKLNTTNKDDYRFGNRLSGTAALFFVQQIKKFGLMPNAGLYFENSATNSQYRTKIENTGGSAYFASAGVETYYKNISMGINYQAPLVQHLAADHSKAHERALVHITYMF